MTITLNLPYPVSANVYWRTAVRGKFAKTYISKQAEDYKRKIKAIAGDLSMLQGDISVSLVLAPRLTKKNAPSRVLIDLDNSIKVTLDALIGIVYADDKQVKHISARYGEPVQDGGLTVEIAAYNGVVNESI